MKLLEESALPHCAAVVDAERRLADAGHLGAADAEALEVVGTGVLCQADTVCPISQLVMRNPVVK